MKLSTVRVKDYWSIRDSDPIDKIGEITCLVGKNEAGKTALLQAIYKLNPIIEEDGYFDITDDYPRVDVEDYQQDIDNGEEHAQVITATFELDKEDLKDLHEEFGKNILNKNQLILSRSYDNSLKVVLDLNKEAMIKKCCENAQLPSDLLKILCKSKNFDELQKLMEENKSGENTDHINRLHSIVSEILKAKTPIFYIYNTFFKSSVPKFLYFDEYYLLEGQANIEALMLREAEEKLKKSDRPLLGLIKLARLDLEELTNPERTEWLINKLEGTSNHLSGKILKYWSQNKHLQLKFDVRPGRPGDPAEMRTGNNLWARVYDSKHLVTTSLGSRSRGFVWFFSFLAWFDQEQKKKRPLILLLDEPGLFLHGKAQGDLLTYIEKELRGQHQVIYTTHSPFMIDPRKFNRVKIVQDKSMDTNEDLPLEERGTKVFAEVLEASEDSLFPLQGALGYEIHQTLFVGPNSLIVEGSSDLLYIQTISGLLEEKGRKGLSKKWTITPVGGSEKVPTFVALLGAQKGLKIATLIDIQKKDRQRIEEIYKKKLLKKKNVFTFDKFCNKSEADIEDMFGDKFYLKLVNSEYKSLLSKNILIKDLPQGPPRVLVRLENYFKNNPLKNANFNHYRPSRFFTENISILKNDVPDKTLDGFENVFKKLNKLL